jgi:hypothetical protein
VLMLKAGIWSDIVEVLWCLCLVPSGRRKGNQGEKGCVTGWLCWNVTSRWIDHTEENYVGSNRRQK